MEIRATLKNEYLIKVRDANTGVTKGEYKAHNVITRRMLEYLYSRTKYAYIAVGTGTGTPSFDRTSLFNYSARYATSMEGNLIEVDENTFGQQYTARIPADALVGQSLTELGLSTNSTAGVTTHAMITDSEGNQIAIEKTEQDIIDLYITLYMTFPQPTEGVDPIIDKKQMASEFLRRTSSSDYNPTMHLRRYAEVIDGKVVVYGDSNSTGSTSGTGTRIEGTSSIRTMTRRLTESQFNGMIGAAVVGGSRTALPLIAFPLPVPGVWEGETFSDKFVANGDGETKRFLLDPSITEEGSIRVYVDGEQVTPTKVNARAGYTDIGIISTEGFKGSFGCYVEDVFLTYSTNTLYVYKVVGDDLVLIRENQVSYNIYSAHINGDKDIVTMTTSSGLKLVGIDIESGALTEEYAPGPDIMPYLNSILDALIPYGGNVLVVTNDNGFSGLGQSGKIASFSVDKIAKTFGDFIIQSTNPPYSTIYKNRLVQILKGKVLALAGRYDDAWLVQFEPATGAFGASKSVDLNTMDRLVSYDSQYIYGSRSSNASASTVYIWQVDEHLNTKRIGPTRIGSGYYHTNVSPSGRIIILSGSMYVAEDTDSEHVNHGSVGWREDFEGHMFLNEDIIISNNRVIRVINLPSYNFELPEAPPVGSVITADYTTPLIPKSTENLLTVEVELVISV